MIKTSNRYFGSFVERIGIRSFLPVTVAHKLREECPVVGRSFALTGVTVHNVFLAGDAQKL